LLIIAKVALVLLAIDYCVEGAFFRTFILPLYVSPHLLLRDRSGGQNLNILFDTLERTPGHRARVALIGDSTMNAADGLDNTTIPYLLGENLRQHMQRQDIETVDCSEIGQYAGDAVLFLAKLLPHQADVVVYGVSLRALPRAPDTRWVSRINEALDVDDFWRIVDVGGASWLRRMMTAEQVLTGLVRSHWSTYAYRGQLRKALSEQVLQPILGRVPIVGRLLRTAQLPDAQASAPRPPTFNALEWPTVEYAPPSANWEALDVFGQLCATYAAKRCVVYAGPINPLERDRLVEPTLYAEYMARLRIMVGRYGLIWRDYTDAMTAADFRTPKYGGSRDPIHMNEQGRAKLAKLLLEPVEEVLANAS
jgi:hypothetical protein